MSPLETLFPGGEFTRAEDIYERAPLSNYFIAEIARARTGSRAARFAGKRALRVIEIGAGTGATTSALIAGARRARRRVSFHRCFGRLPTSRSRRSSPPGRVCATACWISTTPLEASGYQPGSFDVVVATNVLHATANLDETLQRVHELLAPGGHLIL